MGKIEAGRKMEKGLLGNRSAVAQAMMAAGGKINLHTAGIAVLQGSLPNAGMNSSGCQPAPTKKDKKEKKKKKKEKKKATNKVKKKGKKKDKKKKEKKKDKKKSSSS